MEEPRDGGGAEGNRTPDLLIANEALSQLSYSPIPPESRRPEGPPWGRRKRTRLPVSTANSDGTAGRIPAMRPYRGFAGAGGKAARASRTIFPSSLSGGSSVASLVQ